MEGGAGRGFLHCRPNRPSRGALFPEQTVVPRLAHRFGWVDLVRMRWDAKATGCHEGAVGRAFDHLPEVCDRVCDGRCSHRQVGSSRRLEKSCADRLNGLHGTPWGCQSVLRRRCQSSRACRLGTRLEVPCRNRSRHAGVIDPSSFHPREDAECHEFLVLPRGSPPERSHLAPGRRESVVCGLTTLGWVRSVRGRC